MRSRSQTPFIWPLLLVVAGILLLLNNFLLISVDIVELWPLLLVFIGIQLLWRGDFAPSWQAQSFGITRGSVNAGILEVSSGEIDVKLRALQRPGRLIAGQYTARSRPNLNVRNNRASLVMRRGHTWLFSFADWELGLAQQLPWALLVSAHLGQLDVDMRGLNISQAHVAAGIGDIRVICSENVSGPVYARSTFGDVRLAIPDDVPAIIWIKAGPLCRVIRHSRQFREQPDHAIITSSYNPEAPALKVTVSSTFGNIHLISVPAQLSAEDQIDTI